MKTNTISSLMKGCLGVLIMTLGVSAQANVITILDVDFMSTAEVDCEAGAIDPACLGFIGDDPYSLSSTNAQIYDLGNASEGEETDFLNDLIADISGATAVSETDTERLDAGGVDSFSFSTDALWFAIKTGLGTSFFRNEGGPIVLDVVYTKNDGQSGGQGAGISHVTVWNGDDTFEVAEPGTLLLLGAGLAGLGLARRRKI